MQVLLFTFCFVCVQYLHMIVRYRFHLFTSDTHRCHLFPCLSRSFLLFLVFSVSFLGRLCRSVFFSAEVEPSLLRHLPVFRPLALLPVADCPGRDMLGIGALCLR